MDKNYADSILKNFGQKVGIPDLCFDEEGYCCLSFDDLIVNIEIDEDSKRLFLYSNIGELTTKKSEKFYEMLLEANFLFRETNGAVIGIDTEKNIISLCYQIPFSTLTDEVFEIVLENFVNLTELWTQRIRDYTEKEAESEKDIGDFTLKV